MIKLDGVAVPKIDSDYLGFDPYDHQANAEKLIQSNDSFFAVNTSPTGSGKTYSWLKPALEEKIDTMAVFPTNALIADQTESIEELIRSDFPNASVVPVTGQTVAKWIHEFRSISDKGRALRRGVGESLDTNQVTIVVTNPDIFTLMRKDMFSHKDVAGLPERFGMLVFDEFHLADVRQRDLLLFLVDELHELPDTVSMMNRFFFLSATPDDSTVSRSIFDRITEDIGESVHILSSEAIPLSKASKSDSGVMPRVNLKLRETQTFKTGDRLLNDYIVDDFIEFCSTEQTVVMLDGVHEVDEVYDKLSDEVDGTVHKITGFDKKKAKRKIQNFDVLISNSAVEVGLDFQPERLVFSASNAATLIQRLGRLRKLPDRTKPHKAWCFLPKSIKAKVESELEDQNLISRSEFENCIKQTFSDEIDLSSYSWRWSDIEAYHHVNHRVKQFPSDKQDQILQRGLERIDRHYYKPFNRMFDADDLERLVNTTSNQFIDELKTYRGSGLQVMIKDRQSDTMKLYNMLHLLRWGNVKFFDPNKFKSRLSDEDLQFFEGNKNYSVGYCEFNGRITTDPSDEYSGRTVKFQSANRIIHHMIEKEDDRTRKPRLLTGLDVYIDRNNYSRISGLDHLREGLNDVERLIYAYPGKPSSNKTHYGFGDFFFVYPFHRKGNDCSITFGTTALYMHCLVQDREEKKYEERDWSWN